jgi:beta-lactamase class A
MDATAAQALQEQIEAIGQGIDGVIGAYIKDLASGAEVAHNADTPFPMASVVKVPILYELYRQVEAGSVDLNKRILFAAHHLVPGSGILQDLDFGLAPTLKDLATLMITVSDNAATDLVIEQIGRAQVETAMQALGLTSTTIPLTIRGLLYNTVGLDEANPEHTYDLYQQRSKEGYIDWQCRAYGDIDNNVSTPRDIGLLLEDIERRATLSAAARDDRHPQAPEIQHDHPAAPAGRGDERAQDRQPARHPQRRRDRLPPRRSLHHQPLLQAPRRHGRRCRRAGADQQAGLGGDRRPDPRAEVGGVAE